MAVTLTRPDHEIQQMPLVELVFEILKANKEPIYFRDIMKEVQVLRKLSDEQVADVIARVFTEINIDGRFVCVGQNVWGLIRWYPTEKTQDRVGSKKFLRKTGDAFGDDDEDDEYDDVDVLDADEHDFDAVPVEEAEFGVPVETEDEEEEEEEEVVSEEEFEEEPLFEEEEDEEEDGD